MDIKRLQEDLVSIYTDYLIYALTKDKNLLERLSESEVKSLRLTTRDARRNIDILLQNIRDNRFVDDIFTQFELALISMMEEEIPTISASTSLTAGS